MTDDPHLAADRRAILLAGIAAAVPIASQPARGAALDLAVGRVAFRRSSIRFVDLTHKLTKAFNFGQAQPRISAEAIDGSGKAAGMRLNRLSLVEHTGTHIDAPSHFAADAADLGRIPLSDLVVPLAVLDVRARLAADANYQVGPDDIARWEQRHGRLPQGCCVAMWSGFDPLAPRRRPARAAPSPPSSPGFGPAVLDLLIGRTVKGVAVDSMNIDSGDRVPAYPFHAAWLAAGRWGVEGITNLGSVPAAGALLIVGAPPIEGATGMPIRAIAPF